MRPIDADKLKQDLLDKSFYPAIVARAIDNAPTVNPYEWISVKDKQQQPPVREEVIVVICDNSGDSSFKYTTSGWLTAHNGVWIVDNDVCPYVTHWMPFPAPPREDIVFGYEQCMTCNCYEQCMDDIINHPEWVVKCINFGSLRKRIEETMSKEN